MNLITEYIEHVENTNYPPKQKQQQLEIAYRAKAELTGKDVTWHFGKADFVIQTQTAGQQINQRVQAFKNVITDSKNKDLLCRGLDSMGHLILDKIFKAVKEIKNLFTDARDSKNTLLSRSGFFTNYREIGTAFVDAINKPAPISMR